VFLSAEVNRPPDVVERWLAELEEPAAASVTA
jgi:hypothetical protein